MRRNWFWAGIFAFGLLLAGCGGGDDRLTTFVSEDGVVTVEIPPGAARDGIDATVSRSDISSLGVDTSDLESVLLVYELGPDGAEFDEPVTVTFRIPPALGEFDPSRGLPLALVVIEDGAGGYEPLKSMRSFLDGDVLVVEGTTTHFSTAVVELLGGSILLSPQAGFRQFVVDLQFEVRVLEVYGGVHSFDLGSLADAEEDPTSLFTVGRIDWSSEDPIDIVLIDPDRNQAVMNCTARGEDITIRAEVYGATSQIASPAGGWILAHLLTGGSAEFLGNLSLEIECVGGVSSTSSTSTTTTTLPPGQDPPGDQKDGESNKVEPGGGASGGDVVQVANRSGPGDTQVFIIEVDGDGRSLAESSDTQWYDVSVEVVGPDGEQWKANVTISRGEAKDRGVWIGPNAPGRSFLQGAVSTVKWIDMSTLELTVDGGGEQLGVQSFTVAIGVRLSDGQTFWDYASGVAPP